MIAVLAPYVNSYRRYVRDHAAPINLEWGRDNRTTGHPHPAVGARERAGSKTASPGMDCNPYLGIAASLAAGYLGLIEKNAARARSSAATPMTARKRIPRDLGAALDLFDEATKMHEVLGPEFARVYSIVKRAEHNEFLQVISPWEREHLLLNV